MPAISGATSSTHVLTAGNVGKLIHCQVTATNSVGASSANSNTVGPIEEAGVGGAFTLIANTVAGSPDGDTFSTSAIDTTGANLLIVAVAYSDGTGATNFTDSKSNTWTVRTAYIDPGHAAIRLVYCVPTSVGPGHTLTLSGISYASLSFAAFSGAIATPFDIDTGSSGSGGTASAGSGITPNYNNALVVACVSAETVTADAISGGFTLLASSGATGANYRTRFAYLMQTTAAAADPDWTLSGSNSWAATIASFRSV